VKAQRAIDKYLAQYALLPTDPPLPPERWQHVLVAPCFNEAPGFIALWQSEFKQTSLLIILVLNRPESSADTINDPVRLALNEYSSTALQSGYSLHQLSHSCSVLCIDLEAIEGATPSKEGVGRARRVGCDLALWLHRKGVIESPWIYSGDADALWPAQLFTTDWPNATSAVVVPFTHRSSPAQSSADNPTGAVIEATLLYELKLLHYALHLQRIGSIYGFHTLGSSCVFSGEAYAAVRGMPLRNAAEDFYLLNKLAKVAPIHSAQGDGVIIAPRISTRVPFGTGPAVDKLLGVGDLYREPLFYDAHCFDVLAKLRALFDDWVEIAAPDPRQQLGQCFGPAMGADLHELLSTWHYLDALAHIRRAGAGPAQRIQHSTTWFDGFKILKIIHHLRDRYYPNVTFNESVKTPRHWPLERDHTPNGLLSAIHRKLGWFQS